MQLARSLDQILKIHSVLVLGASSALADELRGAGLEAQRYEWQSAAVTSAPRNYDLALCLSAPHLTPEECASIAAALTKKTQRVLFSSLSPAGCGQWLRALLVSGFTPDLSFDAHWAGPGAVLLSAGANPDQADILAELLRLRSETAALSVSGAGGWDLRHTELERAVQSLREFASEIRAREERVDLRLAQLHARTHQLSHAVKSILESRIWRSLVTAGGWILQARELSSRIGRSPNGNRHPPKSAAGSIVKVHCDEPGGAALDLLRTGISGALRVRGWAVSEREISRVEIQIGQNPPVEARIGLHRPELEDLYPGIRNSAKSGFVGQINTLAIPDGRYTLKIRAVDSGGTAAEIELPCKVDHIHGYANDYDRWIKAFEKETRRRSSWFFGPLRTGPASA